MIQLALRPATPAQLTTQQVRAQQNSLAQRVDAGETLRSGDFIPLWGNQYDVLQLSAKALATLAPPDNVINALQPLLGHAHLSKRVFNRVVKALLPKLDYQTYKKCLCDAAATPTVAYCLADFQHGKCCYCEHKISPQLEADVEHFRPKTHIQDCHHPGYWWLAYAWDNYFLACKICNTVYKGNQFPLAKNGQRATKPTDSLGRENALLLHPILDNPEQWITYECAPRLVKAVATDARGQSTINTLTGINHVSRMQARANLIPDMLFISTQMQYAQDSGEQGRIALCIAAIQHYTARHQSYLGFRRFFFRAQGLAEYLS